MIEKRTTSRAKRILIFALALVLSCAVFSSCGEYKEIVDDIEIKDTPRPTMEPIATIEPDYGAPKTGGTVTVGVSATEERHPLFTDSEEIKYCMSLVFEGLVRYDNSGNIETCLASAWETEDNMCYTFELRRDVKWHDGSDLVADDVVKSLDLLKNGGGVYSVNISGVKKYFAISPSELYIELEAPDRYFPERLYFPIVKEVGENKELVGTGPYKYLSGNSASVTYTLNNDYWGRIPLYENVKLNFYETEREKYISDNDILFFKGKTVAAYATREGYTSYRYEGRSFAGLVPNLVESYSEYDYYTGEFLYKDINVAATAAGRKALYYCINRDKLISSVLSGNGKVADWPVYSGFKPAFDNGLTYTQNREKANELFKLAGLHYSSSERKWYLNEEKTHPCKVTMLVLENNAELAAIAQSLKEDFESAGLEVMIMYMSVEKLARYLTLRTYTFLLLTFEEGDCSQLKRIFSKDGEYNFNNYYNEKLETLMNAVEISMSDSEAEHYAAIVEDVLDEELPMLGLYTQSEAMMISHRIRGYEKGIYGTMNPFYSMAEYWSEIYT